MPTMEMEYLPGEAGPEAITLEEALERIPLGLFQWRLLCMW